MFPVDLLNVHSIKALPGNPCLQNNKTYIHWIILLSNLNIILQLFVFGEKIKQKTNNKKLIQNKQGK